MLFIKMVNVQVNVDSERQARQYCYLDDTYPDAAYLTPHQTELYK